MSRPRRTLGIASLGAAALFLSACGGGDSDKASSASVNPALTKPEIKLGVIVTQTGNSASSDKGGADSAKVWQQWVNDNGGIAGHPVRVVIKDDKSDGATASAAAKELLEDPDVLSITTQASNTEQPVSAALGGTDVAVVGSTGYQTPIWTKHPNYFPTGPQAYPGIVVTQFAAAKSVGASKWASIYCAEIASCKDSLALYDAVAKQQQVQYLGSVAVSTTAPNYTAECLRLKNDGADLLQLNVAPAAGRKFINDCQAQGYDGYFGLSAGAVSGDLAKIADVKFTGGIHGFPWWADAPPVQQFRDAMEKYAPDTDYRNPSATATWASLELVRKATAAIGDNPTRKDVFNGLYALKDEDLGGLLAQKLTYTQGQGGPQINCMWLYKVEKGEFSSAPLTGPSGNSAADGGLKSDCMTAPTR